MGPFWVRSRIWSDHCLESGHPCRLSRTFLSCIAKWVLNNPYLDQLVHASLFSVETDCHFLARLLSCVPGMWLEFSAVGVSSTVTSRWLLLGVYVSSLSWSNYRCPKISLPCLSRRGPSLSDVSTSGSESPIFWQMTECLVVECSWLERSNSHSMKSLRSVCSDLSHYVIVIW